ncbi:MAG TPA: hypothetical protein VGF84_06720 [Micromonosporaceae bacterium]|jgi:hypothetical protein
MSQVITETARSGRMNGWRGLPRDVRRRLRRTRFATVAQAPALAAWAEARWRRMVLVAGALPLVLIAASGLEISAVVGGGQHRTERTVLVGLTLACLVVSMTLGSRGSRNNRRANDLSVILTDSAYAALEADPMAAARPLAVHRRLPRGALLVEFIGLIAACAAIVAAAWDTYGAGYGAAAIGIAVLAALYVTDVAQGGVSLAAGVIRDGEISADLDRDGIRLTPDGPRLPWRLFSQATVDANGGGRFELDLAVRDPAELGRIMREAGPARRRRRAVGNPQTVSVDVRSIREQPLDVLIALRRYIAANDPG